MNICRVLCCENVDLAHVLPIESLAAKSVEETPKLVWLTQRVQHVCAAVHILSDHYRDSRVFCALHAMI